MKNVKRHFNNEGLSFTTIIAKAIEAELVKRADRFYNSGKDIAAKTKEDKNESSGLHQSIN